MANLETLDLLDVIGPVGEINGGQVDAELVEAVASDDSKVNAPNTVEEHVSSEENTTPFGSGSASATANAANEPATGSVNPSILSMPHPKKFTHVNINKKFLEKASSATASGQPVLASPLARTSSSSQKPVLQQAPSHSRLVTAKLTATLPMSTTTGPGWSRPSSTVSSGGPTPLSSANAKPSSAGPTPAPGHPAPVPAPLGKIIQPQPRNVLEQFGASLRKDGGGKSAWGNAKAIASPLNDQSAQNDFPTAAEVAQGRAAKSMEKKQAAQAAAAHKVAVSAEEDTFRGVHLDPNAHHWDEMEEDDDNFLDGVIEFGDGRQYKVQAEPAVQSPSSQNPLEPPTEEGVGLAEPSEQQVIDQHVSKEERFADDFDRSWPRSRPAAPIPSQRDQQSNGPGSSVSSQSHSPQEASRVLFNERLNRMEPYQTSVRHNGTGPSHYMNRRGSRSDHPASPTESRGFRDAPPHTFPQGGVQLLQKAGFTSEQTGGDGHSRPFGDHHGGPRRDFGASGSQQVNRLAFAGPERHRSGTKESYSPLPSAPSGHRAIVSPQFPTDVSRDERRQLPPHLSAIHPPPAPSNRTNVQPESSRPPLQIVTQPTAQDFKSPASSHKALSPLMGSGGLQSSTMPLVDLDEVRKAAMQSAAERARIRRQQEEEEREKEKERARRKAAELEEKMKARVAQEQPPTNAAEHSVTQAEVINVIEEAVRSVTASSGPSAALDVVQEKSITSARPGFSRAPSTRDGNRPEVAQRNSTTVASDAPSLAAETDSWRSKVAPVRSTSAGQSKQEAQAIPAKVLPSLMAAVDTLTINADECLEVVDFSELGKLVGAEHTSSHAVADAQSASAFPPRYPRPTAVDFFDDHGTTSRGPTYRDFTEEGSWRRKQSFVKDVASTLEEHEPSTSSPVKEKLREQTVSSDMMKPTGDASSTASSSVPAHAQDDSGRPPYGPSHASHPGYSRVPLAHQYREAPMSTLNDVISRIKGALDNMHTTAEPQKPQKWLPPALRPKAMPPAESIAHPTEVFDVTVTEPPRSPRPWNVFNVKLPLVSHPVEQTPQKRQYTPKYHSHVRWDIFSWDPPPDRFYRNDFSYNDLIFRRPQYFNRRPKCVVSLPRVRLPHEVAAPASSTPVVNLPAKSPTSRPGKHDFQPLTMSTKPLSDSNHTELDTVSRSPPPSAPSTSSNGASLPKAEIVPAVDANDKLSKPRSHQKMPTGSDVAFYRDSRVEVVTQPTATVSFIVTSELEQDTNGVEKSSTSHTSPSTHEVSQADAPQERVTEWETQKATTSAIGDEAHKAKNSLDQSVATPSQSTTMSWMKSPKTYAVKDSPARAPDPEHLKAVWSQTSAQGALSAVNSLEGIADDLTAVPFTLQEVKSEDGETPPPSGSGPPSRMSIHEVTRAFQQVPSSSSSSHRTASMPSAMPSPASRPMSQQPTFAYVPPSAPSSNVRSMYAPYPSPMMSHSPSPTMMYPPHPMAVSPVPRPMVINGASPQYGQPMWMPVSPAAQTSGGMIRAIASPYPAQLMPYPSPGGVMPMYSSSPQVMQASPPQQSHGVQNRTPGLPMMSPAASHAHVSHPMYAGSPALMQAVPQGHMYPGAVHPNRGQMRVAFDQTPGGPAMAHSGSHHPQHQHSANFTTVPPNSFQRPTW